MEIRFGPSGNSPSFYAQGHKGTVEQPKWLHDLGLNALEYSFGRGVRLTEQSANAIGEQAKLYDIALSVHAPYYINLAAQEQERIDSSLEHLRKSAVAATHLGATRIVFHPGAVGKLPRDVAFASCERSLKLAIDLLDDHGFGALTLCPETMGKIGQIGDLQETIALCTLDDRLIPCCDFGHLYARSLGAFGQAADYANAFDAMEKALGVERARRLHIHFSRIEFTAGGEKRHLNYEDTHFGPNFDPLAAELVKRDYAPVVICESREHIAEDALTYQALYRAYREGKS